VDFPRGCESKKTFTPPERIGDITLINVETKGVN
jgi:hypothetical protein